MQLDTRLPLIAAQAGQVDLAGLYRQKQESDQRAQLMQMRQEQMNWEREKYELDRAIAQDAAKAKAIKEGLKDMAGAVQWADTPQKWAQVQQHYGQYDPQLASIPFEQRESALVKLGQMSEYLEATAPKIMEVRAGSSVAAVSPDGNNVREIVRANPGNASFGDPAIPSAAIEHLKQNPDLRGAFDQKYGQGASAKILGGSGGNAGGGFPPGQ